MFSIKADVAFFQRSTVRRMVVSDFNESSRLLISFPSAATSTDSILPAVTLNSYSPAGTSSNTCICFPSVPFSITVFSSEGCHSLKLPAKKRRFGVPAGAFSMMTVTRYWLKAKTGSNNNRQIITLIVFVVLDFIDTCNLEFPAGLPVYDSHNSGAGSFQCVFKRLRDFIIITIQKGFIDLYPQQSIPLLSADVNSMIF